MCGERVGWVDLHEEKNQPRTNLYLLPNASVHFNEEKTYRFSPDIYRTDNIEDKRKFLMACEIIIQLILIRPFVFFLELI